MRSRKERAYLRSKGSSIAESVLKGRSSTDLVFSRPIIPRSVAPQSYRNTPPRPRRPKGNDATQRHRGISHDNENSKNRVCRRIRCTRRGRLRPTVRPTAVDRVGLAGNGRPEGRSRVRGTQFPHQYAAPRGVSESVQKASKQEQSVSNQAGVARQDGRTRQGQRGIPGQVRLAAASHRYTRPRPQRPPPTPQQRQTRNEGRGDCCSCNGIYGQAAVARCGVR